MKVKRKKDKWDEYVKITAGAFVAAILIFVCIYIFDITDMPSKFGLVNENNSKEWLAFSISFFGAVAASYIGFIGAIMAVSMTAEKQNEFRKEDNRKKVLPLIKVKTNTATANIEKGIPPIIELPKEEQATLLIAISFKNVGQREMYDVWLGGIKYDTEKSDNYCKIVPILYKDDEYNEYNEYITSAIERRQKGEVLGISFKIYFRDCYENWYFQEITGKSTGGVGKRYKVDTFEIRSAPILIDKTELPEAIKKG